MSYGEYSLRVSCAK